MEEVNSYNKSKSEIDTNLSMHQQKFDVAHSNITTSEKRLLFINTRLPELSESLETLNHERVLIEFQIANLKEKILKQREQRNILNNESLLLISNTIIGKLFSLHKVIAVKSITFNSLSITFRNERESYFSALESLIGSDE